MSILEKVLERLDSLQKTVYENKLEILKALVDCPMGKIHEAEIKQLQLWRERMMGKLAVIVALASIFGSGIVIIVTDMLRWKLGIGI